MVQVINRAIVHLPTPTTIHKVGSSQKTFEV